MEEVGGKNIIAKAVNASVASCGLSLGKFLCQRYMDIQRLKHGVVSQIQDKNGKNREESVKYY